MFYVRLWSSDLNEWMDISNGHSDITKTTKKHRAFMLRCEINYAVNEVVLPLS